MNFQQMQHNEESDYEYDDDERSLQTDDLSYLSSSYDTENEDDISVKIGGNIIVDGEGEGEMELEGGVKMPLSMSSNPKYVVLNKQVDSYKDLRNRHAFNKIMSFCLSHSGFKTLFVNYINGTEDSNISNLNKDIQKYVKLQSTTDANDTNAKPINFDNSEYFETGNNGIEKLYEIIYDNKNFNEALDIRNDKVYLSNKFAIELMFCLTHFIYDGCPDIKDTNVPNHQKFKRRYEYRELFVSFVKKYTNNDIENIKGVLVTHDQNSDSEKQKIFMKYLLLLIAFESDKLVAPTMSRQTPFVKLFSIPDPSNATEFINMLKRIMNCFSISENITPARNIIKQFYDNVNLIVNKEILTDNKLTVSQWIKEHLFSTIEFYLNYTLIFMDKTGSMKLKTIEKKGAKIAHNDMKNIINQHVLEYFKTIKQTYDKSRLIQYISNSVDLQEESKQLNISDHNLFFLEYITGINENSTPPEESKASKENKTSKPSQTSGVYFYNHSLPIIPYASGTESSSMTSPVSQVISQVPTTPSVSEMNELNRVNGLTNNPLVSRAASEHNIK